VFFESFSHFFCFSCFSCNFPVFLVIWYTNANTKFHVNTLSLVCLYSLDVHHRDIVFTITFKTIIILWMMIPTYTTILFTIATVIRYTPASNNINNFIGVATSCKFFDILLYLLYKILLYFFFYFFIIFFIFTHTIHSCNKYIHYL